MSRSQNGGRRRKKIRSYSPYPSLNVPAKKKRKTSHHTVKKYKQIQSQDIDINTQQSTSEKKKKLIKKKIIKQKDQNKKICNSEHKLFVIISTILIFLLLCGYVAWSEYSKKLDYQFELERNNHESEMKRIALERAKIDAELEKLQQ